jgi:predicted secreted protein
MKHFHIPSLLVLLLSASCLVAAHAQVLPPPENVVQLSASASVEVPQDLLSLQLGVTREGSDPGQIQAQLKSVLDQALAEAKRSAQPGAMDVRTGNFNVSPRYGRDGRISGWQGTAELLLEGSDFARISQAAGRMQQMSVTGAGFRLSREKRQQAEREVQAEAVARFRARAAELAKAFGFNGYGLREVSVQSQDSGFVPRPRMMAMEAKAASADAAVPVEAGKAAVTVNVSGSVQLR